MSTPSSGYAVTNEQQPKREKVTAPDIRARKGGPKIKMVTAYDAPSATIADRAGADIILVGDSLANVVLGLSDTLTVTVDEMVHHTKAVTRTRPKAHVVGDMPWLSYHLSPEEAVRNAGRFIKEGRAESVKLEGGRNRLEAIEAIIAAEIPVMGHLGLTPQSVNAMGGYKVQGKGVEKAKQLINDAKVLQNAGVYAIVLEGVPTLLGQLITKEIDVPTIGIGAGPYTDGQVLVYHDLLGLHDQRVAKFVRKYANLYEASLEAVTHFFADVEAGVFPSDDEAYEMPEEAEAALFSDEDLRNINFGEDGTVGGESSGGLF
ncbi:MAG: 3-methyl-2-oxobutanoate hydroxymethyltransferase [Acidimicrobiia bacterium]|nr:3-methyl-2-oxobutanoate hydroxymethyltransferase [Acidimicrobiia bacterium]NNL47211.1 3-methyl-2-oxobutanoate hydroxymethyltransferase [Acidimicrobiia bacterium]